MCTSRSSALLIGACVAIGTGCAANPSESILSSSIALRSFSASATELQLQQACSPTGPELCFDAIDNNCNGVIDEGCGVHTGLVQFAVAWAEPTVDVDLLVTGPDGQQATVRRVTSVGLTKDRNCPADDDGCQGQNTENVYLIDREPVRGSYRVVVRLTRLAAAPPPIRVQLGARVGPRVYTTRLQLNAPLEEVSLIFGL